MHAYRCLSGILAALTAALVAVPAANAAPGFFYDSFTQAADGALSGHASDGGSAWAKNGAHTSGDFKVINSTGAVRPDGLKLDEADYANVTLASANYTVEGDITQVTAQTGAYLGVTGRMDTTADTYYQCTYYLPAGQWRLAKNVNGTATLLGSRNQTLTNGTAYHAALTMKGTSISCVAGGSTVASVTDSSISAVGKPGLVGRWTTKTSGTVDSAHSYKLDNFGASVIYTRLRGVNQYDYVYTGGFGGSNPGPYVIPAASMTYIAGRGAKVVRIPVVWGKIQTTSGAALDPTQMGRLDQSIENAAAAGLRVDLDLHTSLRYPDAGSANPVVTQSQFNDIWTKLSQHYKNDPRIWAYGLANEPYNTAYSTIYSLQQGAINTIRSLGDTRRILVSTGNWDSADAWAANPNIFTDSANNLEYEAHNYPGTAQGQTIYNQAAVDSAKSAATSFGNYCSTNSLKCFIGETGWPGSNTSTDWASWNTAGDQLYGIYDSYNMDVTFFGASGAYANSLWAYDNPTPGVNATTGAVNPLNNAETQSTVIEAHPSS